MRDCFYCFVCKKNTYLSIICLILWNICTILSNRCIVSIYQKSKGFAIILYDQLLITDDCYFQYLAKFFDTVKKNIRKWKSHWAEPLSIEHWAAAQCSMLNGLSWLKSAQCYLLNGPCFIVSCSCSLAQWPCLTNAHPWMQCCKIFLTCSASGHNYCRIFGSMNIYILYLIIVLLLSDSFTWIAKV